MKTIKDYLLRIRFESIKSDLKILLWRIYSISIIIFLFIITIENIFYLSSSLRMKFWISALVLFIIMIILLIVASIQIKNNRFKNYKLEFGINNILDNHYFVRRATGYPGPGIIPSPPRNYYITLQLKF